MLSSVGGCVVYMVCACVSTHLSACACNVQWEVYMYNLNTSTCPAAMVVLLISGPHFDCWCSDRSTCSMHVIYMLLYSSVLSMPNIGMHEPVMWDGSDSCCSVCTYICVHTYINIIMCSSSNKGEHIALSSWSSYHREQPVSSQKRRLGTLWKNLNLLVIMVNPWGHEASVGQYRGD